MRGRGPKSGAHSGVAHLRRQPFELAAPDVLEVRRRAGSLARLFVQVDGTFESIGDLPRRPPCELHALAIVTSSSGTNGTTSTAPMRGWSPRCVRRSIVANRTLDQASTARLDARGIAGDREDRTVVRWIGGVIRAAVRRARARIASAIATTTSGRRPSLMFGTHSMRAIRHRHGCTSCTVDAPRVPRPRSCTC